ncbi:hypothetical protein G5714_024589 [Onychostoma macrolepis]|uniref:Uncharacterized protein n=1 Tax=Onychostoma macrolepis TaxID=369639 RepID=A0A7J6BLU9_9TELE|nr:hypothetical protein G5714_024589 [Onychostoma macrolepis]
MGGSACVYPAPRGAGNPLNPARDRDWGLKLFPINEEFPDTLIIDTSNALCGPGFLPGPRLPEGRFPIDRGLRVPRLELRGAFDLLRPPKCRPPGSASRPASSGPFHRLSLPYGRGGRRLVCGSRTGGPPSAAGGSEPLRCPRRDLQLVCGRTSFWWEGSLRLSRPLWGGRAAATRPPVLRGPGSRLNSRADGRTPSLRGARASISRPSGAGGGGDTSARFCEDRGLDPNSRADGRTPSLWGDASVGVSDGVRCARRRPTRLRPASRPSGDSGAPPRPLRVRPQVRRDNPLNLSILLSGGKETNKDSLSSGERRGKSPANPARPRAREMWRQKTALGAGRGPSPSDGGLARGRCEVGGPARRVRFFLESGCLGMQPKDSTRRVRSARSVRVDPLRWGPPPGRWLGRRRAHFFRGGAPRPAPVWPGRVGGRRWLAASGSRALQSPHAPTLPLTPGVVGSVLAPSLLPTGEGRGPSLPVCASTGADCPQSVSDRAAPSGRGSGPRKGCSRSAARSATHPTRLETRTKESNARASQRVSSSPHGAMKVKAGARRSRWDPPAPAGGAPPARLARTAGQVELERVRWYPKDGELCLGRAKPEETLVEARSGPDVQIGRPTWV